ncbi:MAG: DUF5057 domain-containing protein [Lachnospiraceae bacterium]|nr:DUF5057 domain-containing protein [Lachnospiraceae bacterium]
MKKKTGSLKSYNPRKSKKHIFFFNVVPVALSAAVLLGIAGNSAFRSVDATAKTSLLNIEAKKTALKAKGGSFHILEVTPEKENPLYRTTAGSGVITSSSGTGKASADNYDAVTGNFGYLIAGQEPIDFDKTLEYFGTALTSDDKPASKYKDDNDLLDGNSLREARTKWADKYLKALKTAGIASEDKDAAPIQLTKASDGSYYKELKPWETDEKNEKTVELNSTETVYVKGTLTENKTDGSYSASASSYTVDTTGGSYVQNISMQNQLFSAESLTDSDNVSDYVFYKPVFTKVDFSNLSVDEVKNTLYKAQQHGFPFIFSKTEGSEVYSVDQLATADFSDFFTTDQKKLEKAMKQHTFDDTKTYYVVTGADSVVMGSSVGKEGEKTLDDLAGYYAAKLDIEIPYVTTASLLKDDFDQTPATGFFSCNPKFVNYVGKGRGSLDLNFTGESDAGDTDALIINYSVIRYVGGCKNNNWFLKNTLDLDDDEEVDSLADKVYVDCVSPDKVTAEANESGQNQALNKYDLVVISGGLDLFSDSVSYRSEESYSKADCGELKTALKDYLDDKGPVVVDSSALANRDLSDLLSSVKDDKTYKYLDMEKAGDSTAYPYGLVYNSVYLFRDSVETISSDGYKTDFPTAQYKEKNTAFYDVYSEITSENALRERKNPGTTDKLSVKVDEATAIRYIINYAQQRNTAKKSTLKVLDIEPESTLKTYSLDDSSYSFYTVENGKTTKSTHTGFDNSACKEKILEFLPDYKDNPDSVKVTTVSTRTLSGLTDDITENYDLVYIGDYNGLRREYMDSQMNSKSGRSFKDSLVYYNIGDIYRYQSETNLSLKGMLDKEYSESDDKDTYRYSGNDISVKKQKELESFIKQGFPVIISDGLMDDTSHDAFNAKIGINLSFSNEDNSVTAKADPILFDKYDRLQSLDDVNTSDLIKCTYSWYEKKEGGSWKKIDGATGNSIELNDDLLDYSTQSYYYPPKKNSFFCCIDSVTVGDDTIKFYNNIPGNNDGNPGYYFDVNVTRKLDYSTWPAHDVYEMQIYSGNSSHSELINFPASTTTAVSKTTVDNNTRLYKTLNKYIARGNVESYSTAVNDGASVESYASLSAPEIDMIEAPKQYDEKASDHNAIGEYTGDKLDQDTKKLDFRFKIVNQTDLDPTKTRYTATVYADLNSDGVFDAAGEEITSLTVRDSEGEVLPSNLSGGISADKAEEYNLSAQLPESLQGACSWKLVISENSEDSDAAIDDCPKDSYKGISFVGLNDKNSKISIRILQLNSNRNYNKNAKKYFGTESYNLEGLMKNSDKTENGKPNYFGIELTNQLITDSYDIKIKTIPADQFEGFTGKESFKSFIKEYDPDWYQANKNGTWSDYFDMLILGFGDSYDGPGQKGLENVKDFIDTGKAVLFCHDNSLFRNFSENYSNKNNFKFTSAFYYNTILRNKAFMDVYGISDHESQVNGKQLGGQKNWGYGYSSGILAKGQTISSEEADEIEKLGYSVAYKPVSGGNDSGTTVSEVHGFADPGTAHRKNISNGIRTGQDANMKYLRTNKVSQVNKGQITSYPYDINTEEFSTNNRNSVSGKNGFVYTGDNAVMNVSTTHGQYYQLNTNADNIVVWYTVERQYGDLYGYNDCLNNYYIYNCGNITYTGAGHDENTSDVTENEAKLFVNTMIGAFRTTVSKPSAKFVAGEDNDTEVHSTSIQVETDKDGKPVINSANGKNSLTEAVDTAKIYFKITDNSIANGKKEGIKLYDSAKLETVDGKDVYTVDTDSEITGNNIKIHDPKSKDTNKTISVDELESGKIYYFTLPASSKAYMDLNGGKINSSEIWLVPYNKVGGRTTTGDPVKLSIKLAKSSLFDLG